VNELRPVLIMILVVMVAASLVFFMLGEPSLPDVGWALFLVVLWTPVKGISYRRLGGKKSYLGALVGSVAWQALGLPLDLDSWWLIFGVSFVVSVAIETLALAAVGTASALKRCLFLAVFGSLIVHLIQVGWFASHRSLALGLPFLILGIALFILPAFYADRFVHDAP